MIDKSDILSLSRLNALKPFQQEKNYIQTLMLRSIYRSSNNFIFKGGTALFFFYRLPRFSEDLDFNILDGTDEQRTIETLHRDLLLVGVENRFKITSSNETSATYQFSVKGPLYTSEVSGLTVKVDISKREKTLRKPKIMQIDSQYRDVLPFSAIVMDISEIKAEKVRAVTTRDKARDVYDIFFLMRNFGDSMDKDLVNQKLGYYGRKFSIEEFAESLNRKKSKWISELSSIVIGEIPDVNEVVSSIMASAEKHLV